MILLKYAIVLTHVLIELFILIIQLLLEFLVGFHLFLPHFEEITHFLRQFLFCFYEELLMVPDVFF